MRKTILLLLAAVLLFSSAACGVQSGETSGTESQAREEVRPSGVEAYAEMSEREANIKETYTVSSPVAWVNWSDFPVLEEKALNGDALSPGSARLPIYRCDTFDALNEFKSTFTGILALNSTMDEMPSFEEITDEYTEDFFNENDLLLVYVECGSTTPRFCLDRVSVVDGVLTAYVKYSFYPEVGDCAMAGWMLAVPMSKEITRDLSGFDAVLEK